MSDEFDDLAPKEDLEPEFFLIDRSKDAKPRPIVTHKTCKRCCAEKEIKYFSKISEKYFASYCIDCVRAIAKGKYLADKKNRIEEIGEWKEKNHDKVVQYQKKYNQRRQKLKKKIGQPDSLSAASANSVCPPQQIISINGPEDISG